MKYIFLIIGILFLNGCDFKKVDEGKKVPPSAMKCGAGKCGAKMFDKNQSMKCGAGKCGAVKIDTH